MFLEPSHPQDPSIVVSTRTEKQPLLWPRPACPSTKSSLLDSIQSLTVVPASTPPRTPKRAEPTPGLQCGGRELPSEAAGRLPGRFVDQPPRHRCRAQA